MSKPIFMTLDDPLSTSSTLPLGIITKDRSLESTSVGNPSQTENYQVFLGKSLAPITIALAS